MLQCREWCSFLAPLQVRWVLVVDREGPFDLRLVVEADHQVGHQLEEVLPQAQEDVQVEVADVHLAIDARVVQVTHALEAVHIVETEASVHTGFRETFVHVLLTPAKKNTEQMCDTKKKEKLHFKKQLTAAQ